MYSKRYRIESVEEFGRHNSAYEDTETAICYPAYFKVGERGWFLWQDCYDDDWFETPHRFTTSVVKNVEYTDNRIIVETQNTRLTFKLIEE